MSETLLTVGNIYVDHNVFGIQGGEPFCLQPGKDYFGTSGERVLGGSAINAAMQAKRLGLEVGFIGKTGADDGGHEVRELLEAEGILSDLVLEDPNEKTAMAINLVSESGEFIGMHYGNAARMLRAGDIDLEHPLFARASGIYFGGTAKQLHLFDGCAELFEKLSSRDVKVFYDPNRFLAGKTDLDRSLLHQQLPHVEGYFPNEEELLQATGKPTVDEALAEVIASGVTFVALKLGPRGCRIKTKDDDFTIDGYRIKPQTTVGAGDCFNATFITYYLKAYDVRNCAELATAAAALKVSRNIWPDETEIDTFRQSAT